MQTSDEIITTLKLHNDILDRYKVNKIGLFGSYLSGNQKPDSDIDFLVDFKTTSFDNFMDLAFSLEKLFGVKVDLLTPAGLSPYMRPFIEKEIKWYEVR